MSRIMFFGPRSMAVEHVSAVTEYIRQLPAGTEIMVGGAQGFDFAAAWLALDSHLVTILYPSPGYAKYYFSGKGYVPTQIGTPRSLKELVARPNVILGYARQQWSKDVNFTRNTVLAQRCDSAVTLSPEPTSAGTKHALSELFRLGKPVEFILPQ